MGDRLRLSGSLLLTVRVTDVNDNPPACEVAQYDVTVNEDWEIPTSAGTGELVQVHAIDADSGYYGHVTYRFTAETRQDYDHLFSIDSVTGAIYIREYARLTSQRQRLYTLNVEATDERGNGLTGLCKVMVNVTADVINNNAPHINIVPLTEDVSGSGYALIMENAQPGTHVAYVTVKDDDWGVGDEPVRCVVSNSNFALRALSASNYRLVSTHSLDREIRDEYKLDLTCRDSGSPPKTSTSSIIIKVKDENDNRPEFSQNTYVVPVRENNAIGDPLIQLSATDRDTGQNANVTYSVVDSNAVYVEAISGWVKAKLVLDYESQRRFTAVVMATDNGERPKSSTATLIVNVLNIDDNIPEFQQSTYSFEVDENVRINSEVGTVKAFDLDSDFSSSRRKSIIYSIDPHTNPAGVFNVDRDSGIVRVQSQLDREAQDIYQLRLTASDVNAAHIQAGVNVTVRIRDVNDNVPVILFPTHFNNTVYVSSLDAQGHVITTINASDDDLGENGRLTYAIDVNQSDVIARTFDVTADMGTVKVSDKVPRHFTRVRLRIVVRDAGQPSLEASEDLFIEVAAMNGNSNHDNSNHDEMINPTVTIVEVATVLSSSRA
jgi:hypothetical protein